MNRKGFIMIGSGAGLLVIVLLGLFALLVSTDVIVLAFAPQYRQLVALVAGLEVLTLVMLFTLILLGVRGSVRVMRGGST